MPNGWALRSAIAIRKLPVDGERIWISMIPKDERTDDGLALEREEAVHIIICFFSFLFIMRIIMNESGGGM